MRTTPLPPQLAPVILSASSGLWEVTELLNTCHPCHPTLCLCFYDVISFLHPELLSDWSHCDLTSLLLLAHVLRLMSNYLCIFYFCCERAKTSRVTTPEILCLRETTLLQRQGPKLWWGSVPAMMWPRLLSRWWCCFFVVVSLVGIKTAASQSSSHGM